MELEDSASCALLEHGRGETRSALVQPFLFADADWIEVRDGNPSGMSIFRRHYTARARRKVFQFVGPGEKTVLLTPDAGALFVWRKFIDDAIPKQTGVNCCRSFPPRMWQAGE